MNQRIYKIYRGFARMLSKMSFHKLYFLSDLACPVLYHVVRYRRKVVRKNLENSFPGKSHEEILKIERGFYHFFCDYVVETIKLPDLSPERLRRHLSMTGTEDMVRALDEKKMVFIYLGHLCNWEYVATLPLWMPADVHCAQLYSPLRNEYTDRLFYEMRTSSGGENIPKNESLRRILHMKAEGTKNLIGFISDQTPRWVNIHDWVRFLNQDTPVFTGTERIAKKIDAAVFFCDMQRTKRGYYHCTFTLMTDNPRSIPDYQLTEDYMRRLEKCIRRSPECWLWSHNRWKRKRADAYKHQHPAHKADAPAAAPPAEGNDKGK